MILISAFSIIGGAALGLCSKAHAFALRMLAFALALSTATAASRGWGVAAGAGAFALACVGAQIGYFIVILARAGVFAHQVDPTVLRRNLKRAG